MRSHRRRRGKHRRLPRVPDAPVRLRHAHRPRRPRRGARARRLLAGPRAARHHAAGGERLRRLPRDPFGRTPAGDTRPDAHGAGRGRGRRARIRFRGRRLPHEAFRYPRVGAAGARAPRGRCARGCSLMSAEAIVYVVDDDSSTRQLFEWLLQKNGLSAMAFPDARSFLERFRPDAPGCVLVDLHMPGMSGLDLQEALKARGVQMPLIFVSGGADVPDAVRAVKEGAVDFIEKPFDYKHVLALVRECLRRDVEARREREERRAGAERLALLTQREREVLDLVVAGKTNREIGDILEISVKTVEAHRAKLMEKIGADSVAELVQRVLAATR